MTRPQMGAISYNRSVRQEGRGEGRRFRETRLSESYDLPARWVRVSDHKILRSAGAFIVAWEKIGLNGEGLFTHLLAAAKDRVEYEEKLRAISDRRRRGGRAERRDLATIAARGPLVELMKKSGATLPGHPEEELAEAVESWAKDYIEDQLARRSKKLTRGRPGEPWLHKPVIHLAGQLRRVGESWNRTIQLVYEAFGVIGMNDVVTREKVRHIIRAERTKRPGFGRGADEPCKVCVGTSGMGKVLGEAYDFQGKGGPALIEQLIASPNRKRISQKFRQKERTIERRLLQLRSWLRRK